MSWEQRTTSCTLAVHSEQLVMQIARLRTWHWIVYRGKSEYMQIYSETTENVNWIQFICRGNANYSTHDTAANTIALNITMWSLKFQRKLSITGTWNWENSIAVDNL